MLLNTTRETFCRYRQFIPLWERLYKRQVTPHLWGQSLESANYHCNVASNRYPYPLMLKQSLVNHATSRIYCVLVFPSLYKKKKKS